MASANSFEGFIVFSALPEYIYITERMVGILEQYGLSDESVKIIKAAKDMATREKPDGIIAIINNEILQRNNREHPVTEEGKRVYGILFGSV